MIKKTIIAAAFIIPLVLMARDNAAGEGVKVEEPSLVITPGSQYSYDFSISSIDFNKRGHIGGWGEELEVQMIIKNLRNEPRELYIFIIASYEEERGPDPFARGVDRYETTRILNFVPYPDDPANFKYAVLNMEGEPVMDREGSPVTRFRSVPRDPALGVSSDTGGPYLLEDTLVVRTRHLSPYRNNYVFFNKVEVIIFDRYLEPCHRQVYLLRGYRR